MLKLANSIKGQGESDKADEIRSMALADLGVDNAEVIIILTWDTDGSDVDLHLSLEGSNEKCWYENKTTTWGAKLFEDVTGGFGPEFIVISNTDKGSYEIAAHNYSNNSFGTKPNCTLVITTDLGR